MLTHVSEGQRDKISHAEEGIVEHLKLVARLSDPELDLLIAIHNHNIAVAVPGQVQKTIPMWIGEGRGLIS